VSYLKAWLIGFGIFAYFTITTVWLPSKLLLGPLAMRGRIVRDLATAVWGFFLLLGLWALRRAQSRDLI